MGERRGRQTKKDTLKTEEKRWMKRKQFISIATLLLLPRICGLLLLQEHVQYRAVGTF